MILGLMSASVPSWQKGAAWNNVQAGYHAVVEAAQEVSGSAQRKRTYAILEALQGASAVQQRVCQEVGMARETILSMKEEQDKANLQLAKVIGQAAEQGPSIRAGIRVGVRAEIERETGAGRRGSITSQTSTSTETTTGPSAEIFDEAAANGQQGSPGWNFRKIPVAEVRPFVEAYVDFSMPLWKPGGPPELKEMIQGSQKR